ncbi:zinc-dependent metalloprotease [Nakamurella deserti]|uniref:zinc-dependent metalloprotease n=1 Tax=Nakamurella deserti TaxID=2164074 RepID=UPI000DBE434F|nr:zinc-dependent metalloprotease [Nakamurella deserti]
MAGATDIDWDAAVAFGRRAAPTGPRIGRIEAATAVAELRAFSRRAELAVRGVTHLGDGLPVLDGVVVDRPGWIAATAEGMAVLTAPITARFAEQLARRDDKDTRSRGGAHRVAAPSTVAAAPVGTVLGFLSGKVLGQFDPFVGDPAHPGRPGRLLLVAPNIIKVERELGADPQDFRMWVCLHESTHRLQFSAVPWLRDHFQGLVARFAAEADLDPAALVDRLAAVIRSRGNGGVSWIEATQTDAQRVVFDQLLALMTLLEGHADHVMDAVGPQVVPSVAQIRARFTRRRARGGGPVDRIVRSLLGMDLKMKQYVQGGAFVHAVVEQVGMFGFNAVWSSPAALPTRAEIADPAAWIARVL